MSAIEGTQYTKLHSAALRVFTAVGRPHRLVEPALSSRAGMRGYFFTVTWMSFRYLTGWPFSIAGLYLQSRAAARSRLS